MSQALKNVLQEHKQILAEQEGESQELDLDFHVMPAGYEEENKEAGRVHVGQGVELTQRKGNQNLLFFVVILFLVFFLMRN